MSSSSSSGQNKCSKCHKPNPRKRCSICHLAVYCDRKCQTADWTAHEKVCKALKEQNDNQNVNQHKNEDLSVRRRSATKSKTMNKRKKKRKTSDDNNNRIELESNPSKKRKLNHNQTAPEGDTLSNSNSNNRTDSHQKLQTNTEDIEMNDKRNDEDLLNDDNSNHNASVENEDFHVEMVDLVSVDGDVELVCNISRIHAFKKKNK